MYNDVLKTRYIETLEKEAIKTLLTKEFESCASTEDKISKDIKDFNRTEILDYYTSLKTYSLDSIMVRNYRFEHYADWCISNKEKNSKNEFAEITTEMLMDCLDQDVVNSLVLTREQVLEVIDKLPYGEAFLILALFEGICGKDYEEFHDLKLGDFKVNGNIITVSLCTGRELTVTKELYDYAVKATKQFSYTKNGKIIHFDAGDIRILKTKANAGRTNDYDLDDDVIYRRNYRRILTMTMRLRKEIGLQGLKISFLQVSGRIHLIKEMMKNNEDNNQRQYVNCEEATYRYGVVGSVPRWMMKYGQYL